MDDRETEPLLSPAQRQSHPVRLYWTRWYILVVFSLLASYHGAAFNFYIVIPHSVKLVYGWGVNDLATLSNWGPIASVVLTPILTGLLSNRGLRMSVLFCVGLILTGAVLRALTLSSPSALWFANFASILIGAAGPILNFAQPVIAEAWFSHKERVTATTISIALTYLAISSLLGLYVISDCVEPTVNTTLDNGGNCSGNSTALSLIREDISELGYEECIIAGVFLVVVLAYFPDKPPAHPSISAGTVRAGFYSGLRAILRNKRAWLILTVGALVKGIYNYWYGMLPVNVQQHLNIDQKDAEWISICGSIATVIFGVIAARLVDRLSGMMKATILCQLIGGIVGIAWLELQFYGFLTGGTIATTYIAFIMTASFVPAIVPMCMELSCEVAYPVQEAVVGGLGLMTANVVSIIFLLIFLIPGIGTSWMNWVMIGTLAVCVVLMLLFKERYTRMKMDVLCNDEPGNIQHRPTKYDSAGHTDDIRASSDHEHTARPNKFDSAGYRDDVRAPQLS